MSMHTLRCLNCWWLFAILEDMDRFIDGRPALSWQNGYIPIVARRMVRYVVR